MKLEKQREDLAVASHRLAENGLVIGTSGNLSMREGDLVALTPTGAVLADVTPEMMTVVDMDGQIVDGDLAPTSELAMHLGIYAKFPSSAIAHAHSMASTAVACTHKELPPVHYTILSLGGTIRVAPYATFGSEELAANVIAALEGRQAALMENHGSIAHAATMADACERLELLEWLSELYSRTLTIGKPNILTDADLEAVIMAAITKSYGSIRKVTEEKS